MRQGGTYRWCRKHGRRWHPHTAKGMWLYFNGDKFRCGKLVAFTEQDLPETCNLPVTRRKSRRR